MRRKLDQRLAQLAGRAGQCPPDGWVRTLRDALGMSAFELAARMKVTPARVSQIERAEVSGSLRLSTLSRAGEALGCRLVYALVPEASLEEMVRRQAFLKAAQELEELDGSDIWSDDEGLAAAVLLEHQKAQALSWVDRRGLWKNSPSQPVAMAGPAPPDPPESRGGAP